MSPQGVVFATAMAVSGTVVLLVLKLQKSLPNTQFSVDQIPQSSQPILRSCISSGTQKRVLFTCSTIYILFISLFLFFWLMGVFCFFVWWRVEEKKREKKKKKVHFAKDVVDPSGDGEEYRKQHGIISTNSSSSSSSSLASSPTPKLEKYRGQTRGMPANRVALYNGILRDRVVQRMGYSYWSNFRAKICVYGLQCRLFFTILLFNF